MIPILEHIARAPRLLVACDFDGVLAPLAPRPELARPIDTSLAALRRLASLPQTDAAIISGRGRADLRRMLREADPLRLVGSHGAESEETDAHPTPEQQRRLGDLTALLHEWAPARDGYLVETKPLGVALHYRAAPPGHAAELLARLRARFEREPGLRLRAGVMVLELSLSDSDKGRALTRLRHQCGSAAVLFLGDDETDEDAFAVMGPGDAAVKVGDGPTAAPYRVAGPDEARLLLERLLELRRAWLGALGAPALERLSILSDQRTIALVDDAARLVWLCLPRADSPALFAELLGGPGAGVFSVAPARGGGPPRQRYLGDSLILRSEWPGLAVTDYLDASGGRPWQRAGRSHLVRVVEGEARAEVRFAPRLDFGRTPTRLRARDGGLEIMGHADPAVLHAPGVAWRLEREGVHDAAVAEIDPSRGPIELTLRYGAGSLAPPDLPEPRVRDQTERFWSQWAASLTPPPVATELVRRGALVLKALTSGPTGAILAAGTTSLPEWPGGGRNWDYRFCWPRDAALAAGALVRLGNTGVAMKLLDWLLGILDHLDGPERLRPIYTVSGGGLPPEAEVTGLDGWRASRPVRLGNAAANQVQLDVFGAIADLVALLAEAGAPLSPEHWRLAQAMVTAVERRWREPDHGIWEIRAEPRHHVHSKVMSWVAVDRGITLARRLMDERRPGWERLREEIAADVLTRGWSDAARAYTTAYGSDDLDAAALLIGLSGLLPARDERFVSTVDAVNRVLRRGPTVRRYLFDDGLPGREGGFHICTGWLVESLLLVGRTGEARELFDEWTALAGPTGMMPEQYDPDRREHLGNTPQAYSHLAVINAAAALSRAGA